MTTPPTRGPFYAQLAKLKAAQDSVYSQPSLILEDRYTGFAATPGADGARTVPRGAIWTYDPAKPDVHNKFVFHYNPSSININTQVDFSLPTTFQASSDGGSGYTDSGLGQPPGNAETIGFDIFLNRIIESGFAYNGANANLFGVYGTLVDLNILYRAINGWADTDMDGILANGSLTVPPADVGYLTSTRCLLQFGAGDFVWQGYVTNITVNHQKFLSTMTPVLTTVNMSFQRSLGAGAVQATNAAPNTTAGATATGSQSGTAADTTTGMATATGSQAGTARPPGMAASGGTSQINP